MQEKAKEQIYNLVKSKIIYKLEDKTEEIKEIGDYRPFFESIFGKKEILVGSVMHSCYTSFGMSFYEQIGKILAESAGFKAETQYTLKGQIDTDTNHFIASHWSNLKTDLKTKKEVVPNKIEEIAEIKRIIKPGKYEVHGDSTVDLFIKKPNGTEFYFDITTVKNNLKSFEVLKQKMLNWIALRASIDKEVDAHTMIVIPYNPYYPNDYIDSQWNSTILDKKHDILVQEEFWNLVGDNPNTFNELLDIFKIVGEELKEKVDEFFNQDMFN